MKYDSSMNMFVVCMDSYRIRNAQIFNTTGFSDEVLMQADPHSPEMDIHWFDAEVTPYVGLVQAQNQQEVCKIAAEHYRYDERILFAIQVKLD